MVYHSRNKNVFFSTLVSKRPTTRTNKLRRRKNLSLTERIQLVELWQESLVTCSEVFLFFIVSIIRIDYKL